MARSCGTNPIAEVIEGQCNLMGRCIEVNEDVLQI